jgi:pSer/pThr/pTyr-binding forkhead associated (FHA) protein
VRVVIDHIAGSRRGQRQEFPATARVRFGRHPDCEVSFDPHRDIDASSRHAELRVAERASGGEDEAQHRWVLVDLGSSNGTYVDGDRVTETLVTQNVPVSVQFGPGGPRIRLFVGDDNAIAVLPPAPIERRRRTWMLPAAAGAITALVGLSLLLTRC